MNVAATKEVKNEAPTLGKLLDAAMLIASSTCISIQKLSERRH